MQNVMCWKDVDYSVPDSSEEVTEVSGRLQQVGARVIDQDQLSPDCPPRISSPFNSPASSVT
jgi:hypothetical protein